ncbi:hypothetical protein MYXA107069_33895 [Myxococcus xanthus]
MGSGRRMLVTRTDGAGSVVRDSGVAPAGGTEGGGVGAVGAWAEPPLRRNESGRAAEGDSPSITGPEGTICVAW